MTLSSISVVNHNRKRTPIGVLFLLAGAQPLKSRSAREARRNRVRIGRLEIGKLACQAESEPIFTRSVNTPVPRDANRRPFLTGSQPIKSRSARETPLDISTLACYTVINFKMTAKGIFDLKGEP